MGVSWECDDARVSVDWGDEKGWCGVFLFFESEDGCLGVEVVPCEPEYVDAVYGCEASSLEFSLACLPGEWQPSCSCYIVDQPVAGLIALGLCRELKCECLFVYHS